ncbi:MAG: hypothetical protein WC821_03730 [archaeon]|jgi:hypothetical protein
MSNKHVKHNASVHEHKTESAPKDKKILGFEMKTIVLLAGLVLISAILATWFGFAAGSASAVPTTVAVDKTVLMSTVESYINSNLLVDPGVSAKIIDANEVGNGLYALSFEIYQNNAKVSAGTLYANKDKVLIGQAFDLNTPLPKAETPATPTETQVKSDKPVVDLYVMSFCPYGNKAEDTMKPVFDLLASKVTFNVHYIVNVSGTNVQSLHGAPEVVQNEREACVLKNYDLNKWFEFATYVNTNCGSNGSCWEAGAKTLGIDTAKISNCVTTEGVALMQANADASNAANANGSPTLLINGVSSTAVYQYGNSEAYKQAICSAFNTAPSECETVLSGSTSTAAGGSC